MLAGGYDKVWAALSVVFDALSATERTTILGATAVEFYRIPPNRLP